MSKVDSMNSWLDTYVSVLNQHTHFFHKKIENNFKLEMDIDQYQKSDVYPYL